MRNTEPSELSVETRTYGDEQIEVHLRKALPRSASFPPDKYPDLEPGVSVDNGIICERDVPVRMRDGVTLYTDIYRPEGRENLAAIGLEDDILTAAQIEELVALKLALVGLAGFEGHYPSEISGGMQKRAGLARAMALDPEILFFDEPSAGLDPISARRLDELILELRESLGATVVVVTHELASIFAIGNNSVFLDPETKTMIAAGDPKALRDDASNPTVRSFLTRGEA